MADSIQFPRGNKATMPVLPNGAPGWCKDEKALYIGHPDGNQKVASAALFKQVADLETAQKAQGAEIAKKLEASAMAAQAALADTADLAAVIGAFNSLIAAMKTSKVMEE